MEVGKMSDGGYFLLLGFWKLNFAYFGHYFNTKTCSINESFFLHSCLPDDCI